MGYHVPLDKGGWEGGIITGAESKVINEEIDEKPIKSGTCSYTHIFIMYTQLIRKMFIYHLHCHQPHLKGYVKK